MITREAARDGHGLFTSPELREAIEVEIQRYP
jgi:hypothetical protein